MKIIYISGGDVSVYDSQVLAYLDFLVEKGHEVYLVQGYDGEEMKGRLEEKMLSHTPVNVKWYHRKPVYGLFESTTIKRMYEAFVSIPDYQHAVVHIRTEIEGAQFLRIALNYNLTNPVLIDIRGVSVEELKYSIKKFSGLRKIKMIIRYNYLKSCLTRTMNSKYSRYAITSVSPAINTYLKKHFPGYSKIYFMHPNIAGAQFVFSPNDRTEIRAKYGIKDEELLAVCSSAGNSVWQKDYLTIKQLLDNGLKVINLSRLDAGIKGCVTITVPFTDMPKMLSAADVAVLWRDNTFMNNSASPSKFSEFAAMGLYVIHNKSVAIATEYLKESGSGMLVDEVEEINEFPSDLILTSRQERYKKGQKTFGVEGLGASYIDAYKCI